MGDWQSVQVGGANSHVLVATREVALEPVDSRGRGSNVGEFVKQSCMVNAVESFREVL